MCTCGPYGHLTPPLPELSRNHWEDQGERLIWKELTPLKVRQPRTEVLQRVLCPGPSKAQ